LAFDDKHFAFRSLFRFDARRFDVVDKAGK